MANFLYKSIPEYSKEILDILRDVRTDGENVIEVKPLEEYLDNIDTLTFESIRKYIKNILTLNDIDSISQEYLPYLAYILGHVWNPDLDVEYQRFILKSIIQLHKRKGTRFHIHYNLSYFDPKVQIDEPYKKIFILNKSLLDSDKRFASPDYYSWGIYTVKSDFDHNTVKEIINTTRPAGWRTVFEHLNSWSESFVPRVEDHYWKNIKKTPWYTDVYIKSLHDYIMWGSLKIDSRVLLYEDHAGYFVRGRGKQINLPREYILNSINNVSSRKRIFTNMTLFMDIQKYGDTSVYLGPSVLYNSQFRVEDLGSETLLWPKIEPTDRLFLGSSTAKPSHSKIILGTADRTDGGSLFKNLVHYKSEDWANVGPIVCDVDWAHELGDRKWLEYDRLDIPYKNTSSVYMGLKMILWSSTSAPFYNPNEPYDSYGLKYTFDQRDLDYKFFIHRAFSPKKYSRKIDYNCKLVNGILPDDTTIVLSNYEDLPYTGTLVFNNEFIEYKKDIDSKQYVKFYSNGVEIGKSKYDIINNKVEVSFEQAENKHRIIINKNHKSAVTFDYYLNNILLVRSSDYTTILNTSDTLRIDNLILGLFIDIQMNMSNVLDWQVSVNNISTNSDIQILDLVEKFHFKIGNNPYTIIVDKTEKNIFDSKIFLDTNTLLGIKIDTDNEKIEYFVNQENSKIIDFDTNINIDDIVIEYDKNTKTLLFYNDIDPEIFSLNLGIERQVGTAKITKDNIELKDLNLSILSDRMDISFLTDNDIRTIYGAADGEEVFQIFYYKNKTLLRKDIDYSVEFLPRTIILKDKTLNKTFIFKYQLKPSIPIVKRYIATLGWGNAADCGIIHPKKYRPRLIDRQDLIDYRYKLHKINDIDMKITQFQYLIVYNYLGWEVIDLAEIVPEHNDVYKWDGSFWNYVSKIEDFEKERDKKYKLSRYFSSVEEFNNFNPIVLQPNDKVLVRNITDSTLPKDIIYLWNGTKFIYYDSLENFERDKELEYSIVKTFDSRYEMEHYTGTDIEVGRHVVIKSPKIKDRRKFIAQLHNRKNDIYSSFYLFNDIRNFMGKSVSHPYIETTGRHIYSHIIDFKEQKEKNYISLNLGKIQTLGGKNKDNPVIGGLANQYNMALNRSYIMFDSHSRKSIGAPIISISGKSQPDEFSRKQLRFLIGERKPLGNKLRIEAIIKETKKIDLGKIQLFSKPINTQIHSSFLVFIDLYISTLSGVRADIPGLNLSKIGNIPIRFVKSYKDKQFVIGNKESSKTGNFNIVLGAVINSEISIENFNPSYIEIKRHKIGKIHTDTKASPVGDRLLLGN